MDEDLEDAIRCLHPLMKAVRDLEVQAKNIISAHDTSWRQMMETRDQVAELRALCRRAAVAWEDAVAQCPPECPERQLVDELREAGGET